MSEHLAEASDREKGRGDLVQRLAANTKLYRDVALEVGKELNIPTVDLWKAFIDFTGGWEEGQSVPGSKEDERVEKFRELLRDGLHFNPQG